MKFAAWSLTALAWLTLASLAAPVALAQEVGKAPETRAGMYGVIFAILFIVLVAVASVKNSKRGHDD